MDHIDAPVARVVAFSVFAPRPHGRHSGLPPALERRSPRPSRLITGALRHPLPRPIPALASTS